MPVTPFLQVPDASVYRLADCIVPAALLDPPQATDVRVDIDVDGARISAVYPAGQTAVDFPLVAVSGLVWPPFVDVHTHLDKAHSWDRAPNPDGTWAGALKTIAADRAANWTASDVERRAEFALGCAYAHGTRAIRTHIDTAPPQGAISWPVLARLRDDWASRVTLQMVALVPIDMLAGPEGPGIADLVARYGGVLGCSTAAQPGVADALDRVFRLARDHGLDLDFHADETDDPAARSLGAIADATLRYGYEGRVTCGHVCSLAMQPDAETTIGLVRKAGIAIVSLPMCNLYLQDRMPGRTPRWRGITLVHELAAAGVPVCLAGDNTRDAFYAYGDSDMMEVAREGVRIGHLDHAPFDWCAAVTSTPAQIMGLAPNKVAAGAPADLVAFKARRMSELLARPQSDRLVLRAGRVLNVGVPDYSALDGPDAERPR